MGQQEVYIFLKDHPDKWFTSKEISEATKRSVGSVTVCLKKLRNRKDIQFKRSRKGANKRNQYLYKF
jgi:transcription initiation factor IIE alpha subunit